jgi:hypothetical protein
MREASFRNLKDHEVTLHEKAELPYEVDLWVEKTHRDEFKHFLNAMLYSA